MVEKGRVQHHSISVVGLTSCFARGTKSKTTEHGSVAQLVAHLHGMQGVRGSSPLRSTNTERHPLSGCLSSFHDGVTIAQPGVAPDLFLGALCISAPRLRARR